jgi:hypothetical protein
MACRPVQCVYASDPDHIWNRSFRLFYVRHTLTLLLGLHPAHSLFRPQQSQRKPSQAW